MNHGWLVMVLPTKFIDIVNVLYEMVHNFAVEVEILSEDELPKFNFNFE